MQCTMQCTIQRAGGVPAGAVAGEDAHLLRGAEVRRRRGHRRLLAIDAHDLLPAKGTAT